MTILCPCCGRVTVKGLRKADEEALTRLDAAPDGLTVEELFKGRSLAPTSYKQVFERLKQHLAPVGYRLVNIAGRGGQGHRARYRLEKVGE